MNTTHWSVYDGWDTAKPSGAVGTENFDRWATLREGDGMLVERRYYGSSWDEYVAKQWGWGGGLFWDEMLWSLTDHQGYLRRVLGPTGTVFGSKEYNAFGLMGVPTGELEAVGYTGREYDGYTLLQNSRARMYDPTTGRWYTVDPMGFDAGDANLYRYVGNGVTTRTDPSGMEENGFAAHASKFATGAAAGMLGVEAEKSILEMSQEELQAKLVSNGAGAVEGLRKQLNLIISPNPTAIAEFAQGVIEGFFVDGLWGSLTGLYDLGAGAFDLAKEAVKAHVRVNNYVADKVDKAVFKPAMKTAGTTFVTGVMNLGQMTNRSLTQNWDALTSMGQSTVQTGLQNLDEGIRQVQLEITGDLSSATLQAVQMTQDVKQKVEKALAAGTKMAREMATAIQDVMAGREPTVSPETKKALTLGAVYVSGLMNKMANASPQQLGKLYGWVSYQIAETVVTDLVTAGLAESARAGWIAAKLPKVKSLFKGAGLGDDVAEMSVKVLEKSIDIMTGANKAPHLSPKTGCFVAGTPIWTPDGPKAIEELVPGDMILASPEEAAEHVVEAKMVLQCSRRSAEVWTLRVGGRSLRLTMDHPVYTKSQGWVELYRVTVGDELRGRSGEWTKIDGIEAGSYVEVVYNFEVESWHTFYVGGFDWGFSVWVHNENWCDEILKLSNATKEQAETIKNRIVAQLDKLDDAGRKALTSDELKKLSEIGVDTEKLLARTKLPITLQQQKELAKHTAAVRKELIEDFDLLARELTPSQIKAIADEPWRMRLYFGTALESRVAGKVRDAVRVNPQSVLSDLKWTGRTNAPQDFIGGKGHGFDITGGSKSSIEQHFRRKGVDTVITYDSIPSDLGKKFMKWMDK